MKFGVQGNLYNTTILKASNAPKRCGPLNQYLSSSSPQVVCNFLTTLTHFYNFSILFSFIIQPLTLYIQNFLFTAVVYVIL